MPRSTGRGRPNRPLPRCPRARTSPAAVSPRTSPAAALSPRTVPARLARCRTVPARLTRSRTVPARLDGQHEDVQRAPGAHGRIEPVASPPPGLHLGEPRDPSDQNPPGIDRPAAARDHGGTVLDLGLEGHAIQHEPLLVGQGSPPRLHDAEDLAILGHRARAEIRVRPVHRERGRGPDLSHDADEPSRRGHRPVDRDAVQPPRVEEEHALGPGRPRAEKRGRDKGRARAVAKLEELAEPPVLFRKRPERMDLAPGGIQP